MMRYNVAEVGRRDANSWNDFVLKNPHGTVFHTHEMKQVYEKTRKYKPLLLGVKDENGEYTSGMLSYISTEKEGILSTISQRSVLFGGILYSNEKKDFGGLTKLLEDYKKRVGGKALFTEVRNLFDTSNIKSAMVSHGFQYNNHLNFLVNLTKSEDELWSNIKKSRRNAITKSRRMDVAIEEIVDVSVVSDCYRFLEETYSNAKLPLADESLFTNAFDMLSPKNLIHFFVAKVDNKTIGAIVVLSYKDRVYDWYAGAKLDYRKHCPNDVLPWHAIVWGKENGYKVFDFGGAGKPNEEYGVRDFKSQYGGELVEYGRYRLIHSPVKYKLAENGFRLYRKLFLK